MSQSLQATKHRWPSTIGLVLLLGQLIVTVGYPTVPSKHTSATTTAFPCQGHSCGCVSAELCWQGDCCCYTLEEKLRWAEANGIEPPEQVRPLVAQRQQQAKSSLKKACCCSEEACPTESITSCCPPSSALANETPTVRWVIGVFAQKCRGEGPQGLFFGEPTLPTMNEGFVLNSIVVGVIPVISIHPEALIHPVAVPPPR